MSKEFIVSAYNFIAKNYSQQIDHKPHNAYYDRPNTLSLLGEVEHKKILDAACGPGKYAEILIENGAEVIGFDISENMINLALERNGKQGHFFIHDLAEPLSMLADGSFDKVLCALALHYVEDWHLTLKEFHRVLTKNGDLVISVEHPFFEYGYFKSDDYFKTELVKCTWHGFGQPVEMHSFRRSIAEVIMPLIQNGFTITNFVEPKPVKAFKALDPKHYEELMKFPAFLCLKASKSS